MTIRRYESGSKEIKCRNCGLLVKASAPRYWDSRDNTYLCETCAQLPREDQKEIAVDVEELVELFKMFDTKLELADKDVVARMAITIFLERRRK